MSRSQVSVDIPDTLMHDAMREAERAGVSVEEWLRGLAEENILHVRTLERFYNKPMTHEKAARTIRTMLENAGNEPPVPGDRLDS